MSFRFRRSFKIAPGLRLNIGKKSASFSIGPRGAKITTGTRGTHVTAGIPGTGLFYTQKVTGSQDDAHHMTQCPYCGHQMRKQWDECPNCHKPLTAKQNASSPPPETDPNSVWGGFAILLVVLMIIWAFFS